MGSINWSVMIKRIIRCLLPYYGGYRKCADSKNLYITYRNYLKFKIIGGGYYYPIPKGCIVVNLHKIFVGYNSTVFRPGCYIQGEGTIRIGNNVQVAQGVGIISTNHDLYDLTRKHPEAIFIGDNCWIGMNAVILAGVTLGDRTIVGAGSIVTKSFPDGNVVIAGNPAHVIKQLDNRPVTEDTRLKYYGFIPYAEFQKQRKKYIDI